MADPLKIYTPQTGIPLCSVEYSPDGEAVLIFKKSGEQVYETMTFYDFMAYMTASVFAIGTEGSKANLSQMARFRRKSE